MNAPYFIKTILVDVYVFLKKCSLTELNTHWTVINTIQENNGEKEVEKEDIETGTVGWRVYWDYIGSAYPFVTVPLLLALVLLAEVSLFNIKIIMQGRRKQIHIWGLPKYWGLTDLLATEITFFWV